MLKIAALVWVMLGTVLAGCAVITVLMVPSLAATPMKFIPLAAVGGYLLGLPLSWAVAAKISAATRQTA
jgi:hypothetical protein